MTQPSFKDLEIAKQPAKKAPLSIPYSMAKTMALFGNKAIINSDKLKKLTNSLTFSNEKAKRELNWELINVL